MKSFCWRGFFVALGLVGAIQPAMAQAPFGSDSLLPLPSVERQSEVVTPTAFGYNRQEEIAPSPSDRMPKQAPSLSESFAPPTELSPDYKGAMQQAWDAPAGCSDGSCGDASCGRGCNKFFIYGGGLILGRANQCDVAVSQNASTYVTSLHTGQADQDWSSGFETTIGYVLPGCCNAISLGYWGLFPSDESYRINAPDVGYTLRPGMGSNLNWVRYDDGTNNYDVNQWMTTSTGFHEIERSFNYNSVELNFLGNSMAWGAVPCCGPGGYACMSGCNNGCCTPRWQFGWLAGFRYFNYNEGFALYTDYDDTTFDSHDPNQLCYHINTNNQLLGFQMGGNGTWCVSKCFSLNGGATAGVYNNHITQTQEIYGSNGYAQIYGGSYSGTDFDFHSTRDALALMGQINLGATYNWGCHWSFTGGYRVVGISGVATGPGNIADNFADPRYIQKICADDSIILHGAYAGATFRW